MTDMHDIDLYVKSIELRRPAGGTWANGVVNDRYGFDALVTADHADHKDYELGRSRISKLWVRGNTTRTTVYRFDCGLDIPAASDEVQVVVDFLCEGIADLVHG